MRFKKLVRRYLIDKLPINYRLAVERAYLYHYYGDAYVGREVRIFRQLSDPCKNSLDIGANWGLMTLFLSKFSSHVYSFEPIPWLCEDLRQKFHEYNVSVVGCALGNVNGEFSINIPWTGSNRLETRSSLIKDFVDETISGKNVTRVEKVDVNVRKLDEFNIRDIGLIKIDVEGFEMEVLEGGEFTIRENMPNMIVEIEKRHQSGKSIYDTFKYLNDLGYFGYFVYNKRLLKIDEFNINTMQDERNEDDKELYVNNFIFSRSPNITLKI